MVVSMQLLQADITQTRVRIITRTRGATGTERVPISAPAHAASAIRGTTRTTVATTTEHEYLKTYLLYYRLCNYFVGLSPTHLKFMHQTRSQDFSIRGWSVHCSMVQTLFL